MAKSAIFVAFLVLLFCSESLQFGQLNVDLIYANDVSVQIENMIIADTSLYLDFIDGLSDEGVYIESVQFNEGSVMVPDDLNVGDSTTVTGVLNANGGIFADSMPDGDFSFTVEDNTGNTQIKGLLSVFGGINADNGKFTVANGSGETRVADALLRADGGIDVSNGLFTVNANDGSFRTQSNVQVDLDIFLGTSSPDARMISRVASNSATSGATILKGQDGSFQGGDLIISPGNGQTVGSIVLGGATNDDLYVGRSATDNAGANGGLTTFAGQDATNGNGGDITITGGDSTGNGDGGDIVLAVGLSQGNGDPGRLILGSDVAGDSNFDLTVTRPDLQSGQGGSTSYFGQSTTNGDAGDLILQAGSVAGGSGAPGNLILEPGTSSTGVLGNIVVGPNSNEDLLITRFQANSGNGGVTTLQAQNALGGNGGDLFLSAGSSGANGDGGSIYLYPGDSSTATSANIFWGNGNDDLVVTRPTSGANSGTATSIFGQDSTTGTGGALTLASGNGATTGGALSITSGTGTNGLGGGIAITAGSGTQQGGDIAITSGSGTNANAVGGDLVFNAGNGSGSTGGNIIINAGTGSTNGDIIIGSTASQFYVDNVPVVIDGASITVQTPTDTLVLTADPLSIVTINGQKVLRSRVDNVQAVNTGVAVDPACANCPTIISDLQTSLSNIINALGECGHGLISLVDATNAPTTCVLP